MSWKPKKAISVATAISAANICSLLDEEDIQTIGSRCMEGYQADVMSRQDWERRQANANKLALQVSEPNPVNSQTKSWGANIKFPLITVAVLQFQARAYLNLVSGTDVVKFRVIGNDPDGAKTQRAERVGAHMSWQCLEEDPSWQQDTDKLLIVLPLAGCCYRKTAFEPGPGRMVSQLVLPQNLVTNYYTRSLDDSPRYTHTFYFTQNNVKQRELDRRYREMPEDSGGNSTDSTNAGNQAQTAITDAADKRQGIQRPADDISSPFFMGEQYCWLDLDSDGYEEPYIVTIDLERGFVRRIVARFDPSEVKFSDSTKLTEYAEEYQDDNDRRTRYNVPTGKNIYKITPIRVFTKYGFIPSPDGGYYDLGLGSLLGPINATVNTAINQMLDAGTMATLGGGFLGSAFKGVGGPIAFAPQQWHRLNVSGDDIRKSVFPLPVRDPPDVLFKLMGLLIQYAERIVCASDIQMGENPGQYTPAETTRTLDANGRRVYAATYKRIWECMREEFRVRYEVNKLFLPEQSDFHDLTNDKGGLIRPDDYSAPALFVRPAADPEVISDSELIAQADLLVTLSDTHPGFNRRKCMLRALKVRKISNVDEVYPQPMMPDPADPKKQVPAPDVQPPPNPKMLEVQVKMKTAELKEKDVQLKAMDLKVKHMIDAHEAEARIVLLHAQAAKAAAEAKVAANDPLMQLIHESIEAEEKHRDRALKLADQLTDMIGDINGGGSEAGGNAGNAGLEKSSANATVSKVARSNGASQPGSVGGAA